MATLSNVHLLKAVTVDQRTCLPWGGNVTYHHACHVNAVILARMCSTSRNAS